MSTISHRNIAEAPPVWRGVLYAVFLGRGAIAGAGVALAMLGILSLASTLPVLATIPVVAWGGEALNIAASIGAVVGAGFQALLNR